MKKIHEKMLKVFESKILVGILYGIGIIIVLTLIFSIGVSVGFHKASFGRAWGDNYERNFGMMPSRQGFGKDNFPNSHGAIGKIIKIELPTIIVQDKDNTEKVILIKNDTEIQKMKTNIQTTDLSINDFIVVIGTPDSQGQIEAKFIRVMPLGMPLPVVPVQ
ncbi:MAG: hypothetical protein WCG28_02265 [bacterium]